MKIIPENNQDIAAIIASEFRCFGGGRTSNFNPLVNALAGEAPSFALGVDVQDVVDRVVELFIEAREYATDPDNIDFSDILDDIDGEKVTYKKSKY